MLKKIRKANSSDEKSNEAGIEISDSEYQWLKRFHDDVRNQFIHFAPMGWSLEVSGLPALGALIARIVNEIELHGWGFRHMSEDEQTKFRIDLDRLARITSNPNTQHN